MNRNYKQSIALFALLCITAIFYLQCSPKRSPAVSSAPNTTPRADSSKGLKATLRAISWLVWRLAPINTNNSALIIKEFNSVTAENDMKVGVLHPTEGTTTGRMPMILSLLQKDITSTYAVIICYGIHRTLNGCLRVRTESRRVSS